MPEIITNEHQRRRSSATKAQIFCQFDNSFLIEANINWPSEDLTSPPKKRKVMESLRIIVKSNVLNVITKVGYFQIWESGRPANDGWAGILRIWITAASPQDQGPLLNVKLSTTTLPGNLSFSWHELSDHVSPVQLVGGRLGCSHVLLVDGQVVLHLVGESPTTGTVGSRGGRGGPELSSASSSHPKQPPSQLSLFLLNLSSSNPKTDLSEEKVQSFNIGRTAGRPSSVSRDDISFAALLPSAVIHSVAHHKQTEVVLSDAWK